MKLTKITVFVLAASVFITSCESTTSTTDRTNSTTISTTTVAPENGSAPAAIDTAVAPPATPVDSVTK